MLASAFVDVLIGSGKCRDPNSGLQQHNTPPPSLGRVHAVVYVLAAGLCYPSRLGAAVRFAAWGVSISNYGSSDPKNEALESKFRLGFAPPPPPGRVHAVVTVRVADLCA